MSTYTIYIKKHCPHSQAAVKAAKSTNAKCNVIDIESYNCTIPQIVNKLKKEGFLKKSVIHKTVPIVFENDTYIGGNSEFQAKLFH